MILKQRVKVQLPLVCSQMIKVPTALNNSREQALISGLLVHEESQNELKDVCQLSQTLEILNRTMRSHLMEGICNYIAHESMSVQALDDPSLFLNAYRS